MIKFFKLVTIASLLFINSASAQSKKQKQQEVYDKIVKANLQHPKIVLKQAIQESGHFKSKAAINKNNILGIMQGSRIRYFSSVEECLLFYKERIQNRYNGGDYYMFLKRIGYAEDKNYTQKLKNTPLFIIE